MCSSLPLPNLFGAERLTGLDRGYNLARVSFEARLPIAVSGRLVPALQPKWRYLACDLIAFQTYLARQVRAFSNYPGSPHGGRDLLSINRYEGEEP